MIQSPRILREAETKKVVVRFSDNGPLTFSRQLDVVADAAIYAFTHDAEPRFPEVRGKIGNLRAQPDFWQQNRRSWKRKTGIWSADLDFSPHFWNRLSEVCGKFRNPRAHRPFRADKLQVGACGIPVRSASFEFAAYFRFSPLRQTVSTYILR